MSHVTDVNCVAIGDTDVGKNALFNTYHYHTFPEDDIPTIFDNYESLLVVDDKTVHLQVHDIVEQKDYDRLRSFGFPDIEVFLVCFSVSDKASFQNVENKWIPEIKPFTAGIPVILVGTKADLRDNPPEGVTLVTEEDAEKMVQRLKLTAYVECSARTQFNLATVFVTAARAVLNPPTQEEEKFQGCCTIV